MNKKSEHYSLTFGEPTCADLSRGTHMAIGAHPDDLEIMAAPLIEECFNDPSKNFVGIVCTHGVTETDLAKEQNSTVLKKIKVRREEQLQAAKFGNYFATIQLGYSSSQVKQKKSVTCQKRLQDLISIVQPEVLYTHNPFDSHSTHRAVFKTVLRALVAERYFPEEFLGCEVWRGLDWLDSSLKKALKVKNPRWIIELISHFKSQNKNGRNYGEGLVGRMRANSTFHSAADVSEVAHILYALDLLPLLHKLPNEKVSTYFQSFIAPLADEIAKDLNF